MKKIAVVGFGFMGKTHYGAWKKIPGAKVVAVCDSNLAQITAKTVGNIKGATDNAKLAKSVKVYENIDVMLAAGGIDIVDITLPTVLHAKMAVKALNAGCHVLCEKPMALSSKDCNAMIRAAKRADRKLMIAQVVRFQASGRFLRDIVKSGKYGALVGADFTRWIAPPRWSANGADWFFDEKKSGGVYLDAHIHDTDLILSLFGKPDKIQSSAHHNSDGYTDHMATIFKYGEAVVTTSGSFAASDSMVFDKSYKLIFEKATIIAAPRRKQEVVVYPEGGKPFSPNVKDSAKAYGDEIKYFFDFVEGRNDGSLMTAESARDSVALVEKERRLAEK